MLLTATVAVLAACVSPGARLERAARAQGLVRRVLHTPVLPLVVHERPGEKAADGLLHLYLGGDGRPWISSSLGPRADRIARDPTPSRSVALELMAADATPAVHVGRPCYHGLHDAPGCAPRLWTRDRYGPEAVAAVAAAIDRLARERGATRLRLIGFSGGGTLAMLVAPRLSAVTHVVTIAASLDPDAWCALHGHAPLSGSLNPARLPPLDPSIAQLHLAGERDHNVPPELIERALEHTPWARVQRVPGADHRCCWDRVWAAVLGQLGH